MSAKSLMKKLKIPEDASKSILFKDKSISGKFSMLPPTVHPNLFDFTGPDKYLFVLAIILNKSSFIDLFPNLIKILDESGALWLVYPKKSSGIKTDLSRDAWWDNLKDCKYRPVSLVSVDNNWTAIRIRHQDNVNIKEKKNIPEINYEKRIINPPNDLLKALANENLLESFNSKSFTFKKEHTEAIINSKKPETRLRRIDKIVAILKAIPQ